jgi:hypothetical protein
MQMPSSGNAMPRVLSASLVALLVTASAAQAAVEGDWPCVQRKVGELTAAQMWDGPALESAAAWRDDPGVAALAAELAQRRLPMDAAAGRVERFAAEAGRNRDAKLTAVFARVLDRLNAERGRLVAGIERYARKQRELAERIKATGLALRARRSEPSAGGPALADLEERLRWDTRIYDERQAALAYVCESPVLVEQRAFALAREIRTRLD